MPTESELPVVPISIRLGVVGHRNPQNPAAVRASVERILAELDGLISHTPHYFELISPLAEGSDRLVAEAVLHWTDRPGGRSHQLIALLPLKEEDYLQDFHTEESKAEFLGLRKQAEVVEVAPGEKSRPAAYRRCGEEVAARCDILIAVWDGKGARGAGGTAETVEYARSIERSLFLIHPETGDITREDPRGKAARSLNHLEAYHLETLGTFQEEVEAEFRNLSESAEECGLGAGTLEAVRELLLPHYVYADRLALRYQRRHVRAGLAIYWLAAMVAATVSALTVLELHSEWFWLEVLEVLVIMGLLWAAHGGDWHRKWIDYRFLAERLRAGVFLAVAGVQARRLQTPAYFRLSHRPDTWMVGVFNAVWAQNVRTGGSVTALFGELKRFLGTVWIGGQVEFYKNASRRNESRHRWLARWGEWLLGLTLLVAAVHALGIGESVRFVLPLPRWLSMAALVIPAVAATLAGIRVHREYYRNSEKYSELARSLALAQARVVESTDRAEFVREIEAANHLMLRENQDWRVIFLLQELRG